MCVILVSLPNSPVKMICFTCVWGSCCCCNKWNKKCDDLKQCKWIFFQFWRSEAWNGCPWGLLGLLPSYEALEEVRVLVFSILLRLPALPWSTSSVHLQHQQKRVFWTWSSGSDSSSLFLFKPISITQDTLLILRSVVRTCGLSSPCYITYHLHRFQGLGCGNSWGEVSSFYLPQSVT